MSRISLNWIHKIAKGRGEWLTLLFSLLLALFIWTVHNLSLKYTTYLQYNLRITTNIEGRVMETLAEDAVMMRVRASGYSLISHRSDDEIDLTLDPKFLHQLAPESDTFMVYISEVKGEIEKFLLEDISTIENFTTEIVRVILPKIDTKKVPVVAQSQVDFSPQYMAISRMSLNPDSILIYGEEDIVENIDAVYTRIISKKKVNKRFQGVVNILPIKGVTISQSQVYYTQEVGRYIEQSIELPLNVINVPLDRDLLPLSTSVTVIYRQLLSSHKALYPADFTCVIDYNDAVSSINSQVVPYLQKAPEGIYSVTFDPPYIDCIILDK